MDLYDKRILEALRDGKPKNFQQILSEVGFSYNTLRIHLTQLVEHGLVARRKRPQQGPGRPQFAYALPKGVDGQAVSVLVTHIRAWWSSPSMSYSVFAGMRKGVTARRLGVDVRPDTAPKS